MLAECFETSAQSVAVCQTFHTSCRTSNSISTTTGYAYLRRVHPTRPSGPIVWLQYSMGKAKQKMAKCRSLEQQLYVYNAAASHIDISVHVLVLSTRSSMSHDSGKDVRSIQIRVAPASLPSKRNPAPCSRKI